MSRKPVPDRGRRRATALHFHDELPAPVVVATGTGTVAERLIALARQHGITVLEDDPNAEALGMLRVGEFIPPDLYEVVAEMLVFVRTMDRERRP